MKLPLRLAIDFDGETIETTGAIENEIGTVIWCLKWNQGCFDTAFLQDSTLVTLQFTVSEDHSFKPNYIRRLRDALLDKNVVIGKFVHVGVADAEGFKFDVDMAGTVRPKDANNPEFTINAYHSPPLEKQAAGQNVEFETKLSPVLTTVEMWKLAAGNKRASCKK